MIRKKVNQTKQKRITVINIQQSVRAGSMNITQRKEKDFWYTVQYKRTTMATRYNKIYQLQIVLDKIKIK